MRNDVTAAVLYRFRAYIAELHQAGRNRSIALQFSSDPEASRFNALVRCHKLMRSAHAELATAEREALDFAAQAMRNFPQEGIFAYGSPRWLDKWDLQHVLFQPIDPKPIDADPDKHPGYDVRVDRWRGKSKP